MPVSGWLAAVDPAGSAVSPEDRGMCDNQELEAKFIVYWLFLAPQTLSSYKVSEYLTLSAAPLVDKW